MKSSHFDFIDIMKAIGIVLITNSHFKLIYEPVASSIAFGGAAGCAIFFFCSGFTLIGCEKKHFIKWMLKRIIRIYPAYYFMLAVYYIVENQKPLFTDIIFPNQFYWFLQAILVFYVLFYVVMKILKQYYKWLIPILYIFVGILYLMTNHEGWDIDYTLSPSHIHWIYYFAIMLLGRYYRELYTGKVINQQQYSNGSGGVLLMIAFISFIVAYSLKFIVNSYPEFLDIQLLFPIFLLLIVILTYKGSSIINISDNPYFVKVVKVISGLTLELYLVQFLCIEIAQRFSAIARIFICLVLIYFSAFTLNKVSCFFVKYVKKCNPALFVG